MEKTSNKLIYQRCWEKNTIKLSIKSYIGCKILVSILANIVSVQCYLEQTLCLFFFLFFVLNLSISVKRSGEKDSLFLCVYTLSHINLAWFHNALLQLVSYITR